MTEYRSLLVGSHFTPPAKAIIAALPRGARLELRPEPSNPYDSQAIQVFWVTPSSMYNREYPPATVEALNATLPDFGFQTEDLLEQEAWLLGHVAKSAGKPLRERESKREGLVGNSELLSAIVEWPHPATLDFAGDGAALIVIEDPA
jgi:hypothetical protein